MRMQMISERENPLLKRREVVVSLDYDGKPTTSKAELQKAVSDELKAPMDGVEITRIISDVGMPKGKAWVKIWKEKKIPAYSEKKAAEGGASVEKPEEAPAEAPAEEKKE